MECTFDCVMTTRLCSAATKQKTRSCERPQDKTNEVDAAFAASFSLQKLFHELDPMAQHVFHGFNIGICWVSLQGCQCGKSAVH